MAFFYLHQAPCCTSFVTKSFIKVFFATCRKIKRKISEKGFEFRTRTHFIFRFGGLSQQAFEERYVIVYSNGAIAYDEWGVKRWISENKKNFTENGLTKVLFMYSSNRIKEVFFWFKLITKWFNQDLFETGIKSPSALIEIFFNIRMSKEHNNRY